MSRPTDDARGARMAAEFAIANLDSFFSPGLFAPPSAGEFEYWCDVLEAADQTLAEFDALTAAQRGAYAL